MRSAWVIRVLCAAALTLPALTVSSASGSTLEDASAPAQALVSYTEEQGGVVFHATSLLVSKGRRATVRFDGHVTRFRIRAARWRRLRTDLRRAHLRRIAGEYGPAAPRGEESRWTIAAGSRSVSISGYPPSPLASVPKAARRQIKPLFGLLHRLAARGARESRRVR